MGDRQVSEDDSIEELEDAEVGADAEGQSMQSCRSECRSAAKVAKCIADVMEQSFQPHPSPAFTRNVLDKGQIAEFTHCGRASLCWILSISNTLSDHHLQMRFKLFG